MLENFHVSESFKVIYKEGNNLFEKLAPEQIRTIRKRMIECILATDMFNHALLFNTFKSKLESYKIVNGQNVDKLLLPDSHKDAEIKNYEIQQMVLSECVHTSDISSPCKDIKVCDKWLELVYVEFFNQGDKEKENGLPVSMLCDRTNTNINKGQVGFIKFIVSPQINLISNLIPEIQPYIDNIRTNLKYYEERIEEVRSVI